MLESSQKVENTSNHQLLDYMDSLPVRYVLMSLKIPVLFCEAKVNDINLQ